MKRTFASEVNPALSDNEIILNGFVHELRVVGKISFLLLRDMSGIVQCIAVKDNLGEKFDVISKLSIESVVEVHGIVKVSKIAKKGVEVEIKDIVVLAAAETLPITVTEKGVQTGFSKRFDYRTIDLRKPQNSAIFKIESALVEGMIHQLEKEGFLHVFTPCLMGATSEGGSAVFKLKYYDKEAYLRQDPQLHRQLAIAGGIEKLYDLGPNWRAEASHTTRHLCEHRAMAVEMAFIKDEHDTMRFEERVIVSAYQNVKKKCAEELELLGVKVEIPETPFPEITFSEGVEILQSMGKNQSEDEDFDAEANNLLWEHVNKKLHKEFYFVNRFPFAIKPFYVMRVDEEPAYARSVDLNYRGLELSSGGQREHRYDKIMEQVKIKEVSPESVAWFTEFFRYGVPPHGGFALGIERLTQSMLNLENIREAVLFPREPDRLLP